MVAELRQPARAEEVEVKAQPTRSRAVTLGVAGAILLLGGLACFLALSHQIFLTDESSHVGYTMSLREGVLPSLDTLVPTEGGGPELEQALERPWPFSVPYIHVANNPPFAYAAAIPFTEASARLGMDGKYLFGVRFANLLGGAVAVGLAYLLGRELSSGDRFVGLVTAGLIAGNIGIAVVTSVANIGGPAFAATTGTTWALARFARRRSLPAATHLGLWCAAAAAVRPMSAVFAMGACGIALLIGLRTHGMRILGPLLARLAAPAVILTGWFYALNVHRYGDPTGTSGLDVPGPGTNSHLDLLLSRSSFVDPLHYMLVEVYGRNPWWEYAGIHEYLVAAGAVAVVLAAIGLAVRSERAPREWSTGPRLAVSSWVSVALLGIIPALLIVQHMSIGGAGHPRYLMPTLPVLAAATALILSRLSRWLGVLAVVGYAIAALTRVEAASDLYRSGILGSRQPTLGGQPFLGLCIVLAVAGAIALICALIWMARTHEPRVLSTNGNPATAPR